MKVKSKNLKMQFLSKLRKHLKSPGLDKILHHKKRKKSFTKKAKDCFIPRKYSPQHSLKCKIIKKAGEKLKEGFKRTWDSDEIAKKRQGLIEYALIKNKIVTASSIVTATTSAKQTPVVENFFSRACPNDERNCSSSEKETSFSEESRNNIAFYSHCSSTESSPTSSSHSNQPEDDMLQARPLLTNKSSFEGEKSTSQTIYKDSGEPTTAKQNAAECSRPSSQKVDIGVQCTTLAIDAIVAGPTTPYNTKNNNEIKDSCLAEKNALFNETSQNERAACSNTVCEEKFDFMLSSSASRNADEMIKQFLQKRSSQKTRELSPELPTHANNNLQNKFIFPNTPQKTRSCQKQPVGASWARTRLILSDETNVGVKEFSSEKISKSRSSPMQQPAYLPPSCSYTSSHNQSYYQCSDSDSTDDEILMNLKQKLKGRDNALKSFLSTLNRSFSLPSDDSSPDAVYSKPYFRH